MKPGIFRKMIDFRTRADKVQNEPEEASWPLLPFVRFQIPLSQKYSTEEGRFFMKGGRVYT